MQLYKLTQEMASAIDRYNSVESEEELMLIEQHLTSLSIPFQEKCVGVAHHIQNLEADEVAIDNEIQRLSQLLQRAKRGKEFFKRYLSGAMLATNTDKIETATLKLSFRKSESVEVVDESLVPEKYKKRKEVVTVDKMAIRADWKVGVGVAGTEIKENKNLQIK